MTENRPLTQHDLVHRLHNWGINLRLLGFVRSFFKPPDTKFKNQDEVANDIATVNTARESLLVEMIARTSKSYIRYFSFLSRFLIVLTFSNFFLSALVFAV